MLGNIISIIDNTAVIDLKIDLKKVDNLINRYVIIQGTDNKIVGEIIDIKNNEAYILHLFLVKERNTDVYTPLSFVTQSSNDVDFNKYLKYQKHIKIVERKIIEAVS